MAGDNLCTQFIFSIESWFEAKNVFLTQMLHLHGVLHCVFDTKRNCSSFLKIAYALKSVNPKISRIGRQKQNNDFFPIWLKEPFWLTILENDIERFDILFLSAKFAKLENSATWP